MNAQKFPWGSRRWDRCGSLMAIDTPNPDPPVPWIIADVVCTACHLSWGGYVHHAVPENRLRCPKCREWTARIDRFWQCDRPEEHAAMRADGLPTQCTGGRWIRTDDALGPGNTC